MKNMDCLFVCLYLRGISARNYVRAFVHCHVCMVDGMKQNDEFWKFTVQGPR